MMLSFTEIGKIRVVLMEQINPFWGILNLVGLLIIKCRCLIDSSMYKSGEGDLFVDVKEAL